MISRITSFIFMMILTITSYFGIPLNSYETKTLFNDENFKNGFTVMSQQTENGAGVPLGDFTYDEKSEKPQWMISQWNSGNCLWENRIESGKYIITDGSTKTVTYNPADNSISMRLNATNVYNGEAATYENWPHLLLEQSPICDYNALSDSEKSFYNCSADRMVLSLDIRLKDFKDTTNKNGINATQFLAYFYLKGTETNDFIWFGVSLFDDRGPTDEVWALDEGSGQMIYCLSSKSTYGSDKKSLFRNGKPYISDEWVHVEVDLTPHIEKAMKEANKSNTFSREVKKEDFYVGGTNIGFEINGNYDCTIDVKDFNITTYNKK